MKSTKSKLVTRETTVPTTSSKKKTDPIHDFLLTNHDSNNIKLFKPNGSYLYWDWIKTIKTSSIATKEGLLIFVGHSNKVLYVGQTEFIANYLPYLKYKFNIQPSRVFVIHNENPSSLIMNTDAYRARFNPLLNSNRNNRFLFDSTKTVLNLSPRCEKIVDWIKSHPTARYKDFLVVYTISDLQALCKCFSLIRHSYKELRAIILSDSKKVVVLNRGL